MLDFSFSKFLAVGQDSFLVDGPTPSYDLDKHRPGVREREYRTSLPYIRELRDRFPPPSVLLGLSAFSIASPTDLCVLSRLEGPQHNSAPLMLGTLYRSRVLAASPSAAVFPAAYSWLQRGRLTFDSHCSRELLQASTPRRIRRRIPFSQPLLPGALPRAIVVLSGFNIQRIPDSTISLKVEVVDVQAYDIIIELVLGKDTLVRSCTVEWLAYDAVVTGGSRADNRPCSMCTGTVEISGGDLSEAKAEDSLELRIVQKDVNFLESAEREFATVPEMCTWISGFEVSTAGDTKIACKCKMPPERDHASVEASTCGNGKVKSVFVTYMAAAEGQPIKEAQHVPNHFIPILINPGNIVFNNPPSDDDDSDSDSDSHSDSDDDDDEDDESEVEDDGSPAQKKVKVDIKDEDLCKICYVREKNCVLVPCGHKCMCTKCAKILKRQRTSPNFMCPICAAKIQKVVKVFDA